MKRVVLVTIFPILLFAKISLVKNSALIFYEGNKKEIIILRNVEQMEAKLFKNRADVKLFLVSGKIILINKLSIKEYKNLENTLTNNTMRILKEIK